ncbi:MAG: phosphatidylserine decarboxylase [candidate division Zixibacteria bacterium]|nr:phosphatidylserine decarboxylase [candidate division Zixibacteria bacterium]
MAKEGIFFLIPFLIIALVFFYLFDDSRNMSWIYLGIGSFTLGCMLMLFFRDPDREIPEGDDLIVSPADGKIVGIEKSGDSNVITIFLSVFNVHINRVPVSGIVKRLKYRRGKFKAAFNSEASSLNERFEIEISTDKGNVTVHQIAGLIARRVVCRLNEGQSVSKGDRFGLIRFGSRVDLFLPLSAQIDVKKGQHIKGALTVIGRLA